MTRTSSILGLQLVVDKFFIYHLVINLTSWSASSAAFTTSAGVKVTAVGNPLIAVIFAVSVVRKLKSFSFHYTHTHTHTHAHTHTCTHTRMHTRTHAHTHAHTHTCTHTHTHTHTHKHTHSHTHIYKKVANVCTRS